MIRENHLKVPCGQIQHILRATLAAVALLTVANPETKAQVGFSVNAGPYLFINSDTVNADTIIGSGNFTGSLDATQGGVDTITVAGGSTITFLGPTPNSAIIDAGLGTITITGPATLNAVGFGERGIYTFSNVTLAAGTQSTTVTNAGNINSDLQSIRVGVLNNIATGSASATITNSGNVTSINDSALSALANSDATSTVNITNSGTLNSSFISILANAVSTAAPTGTASVEINNTGAINSSGADGISANADGFANAAVNITNNGSINTLDDAIVATVDATSGLGGDASLNITNSAILNSTNGYGMFILTDGGTSASANIQNSGDINSDQGSIYIDNDATFAVGGSSAVTVTNSGNLSSINQEGIEIYSYGVTSATTNVQNSGNIISDSEAIYIDNDATSGLGGSSVVTVNNSGNLSSINEAGMEIYSYGVTSASANVQNSGDITSLEDAVYIFSDTTTVGSTGDATVNFSNSGNLLSTNNDAVELNADSRNNASINFSNSGTVDSLSGAADYGIYAFANATTGTGGVASITGSNSGLVSSLNGNAVGLFANGNVAANINFSNSGDITSQNDVGILADADATFAPSANASINISNSGTITSPADSGIEVVAQANGNASTSVSNSGSITASNVGIFAFTASDVDLIGGGSGKTTVTNTGTINAGTWGIYLDGFNFPEADVYNLYGSITSVNDAIYIDPAVGANRTWLVGGNISAGGMVFQGNGNSTLYVINNPQLNGGMMDGGGGTSQIKFQLVGMSPKEAKKAKAQMGNAAGSFSINGGKLEYNWQNFDGGSSGKFISLQTKVDKSLVPAAKWLDNNAYKNQGNIEIAKFYLAAGSNPGKEIANLMGQAEALARNDVLLEYSNLIAYMSFNMGHDFAAGYAARSFDISMVNLYRPDVLMAGNMMMNRLGRISDSPMRSPRKAPVNEISPWSVWLGGNALMATQDKWEDRAGYDNLTGNPMVGLNYRPSANTNIGLMAGATITELDFTNRSKLEGLGGLFALHGTQRFADFYTSAFVGGGLTGFEQERRIRGRTARADFDSSMITGGGNLGYGFKAGNLTLAPEAGLVYTHLMHDGYRERGAGVFNRRVGSSDVDSLKTRLGGRLSYLVEMTDWVFAPFIHASWAHELMYDNNEAPVKLPRFGMPSFDIGNDNPERDSALIGVGVSGKVNKLSQVSWYLGYEANIGFTHYMSHTGSLGFRWDF